MSAGRGPGHRDQIALGDHLADGETRVWVSGAVHLDECTHSLAAARRSGLGRVVIDVVLGDQLFDCVEVAVVPHLLDEAACNGLVLLGHMSPLVVVFATDPNAILNRGVNDWGNRGVERAARDRTRRSAAGA